MKKTYALPFLALFSVVGCGGSGTSGGSRSAPVFITDDLNPDFDAVWVKVQEVTAMRAGQPIGGIVVKGGQNGLNLCDLHDGDGPILSFLGDLRTELKEGDSIHIVFADDVKIHPVGSVASVAATFRGAVGGKKGYDYYLSRKGIQEKGIKLACDLSKWTLTGTTVDAPTDSIGELSLSKPPRYARDRATGMASGRRMMAAGGPGGAIQVDGIDVRFDNSTIVLNDDGSSSPSIADGKRLSAYGKFDPTLNAIKADTVIVCQAAENPLYTGSGHVANNPLYESNSFVVGGTGGFSPSNPKVTVQCTDATKFSVNGVPSERETSFAVLLGSDVQLAGSYDADKNVFFATAVNASRPVETEPVIVGAYILGHRLHRPHLRPTSWYGVDLEGGQTVPVELTSKTVCKIGSQIVTLDAFLNACRGGDSLRTHVRWTGSSWEATQIVHKDLSH